MPSRAASRRIERPSRPSSSSSSRAAATISRARGPRRTVSGALEAIGGAQAVADRAVEGDVERPRERADDEDGGKEAECRGGAERGGPPEAVREVVRGHGARVELPLREPGPGAEEERQVGG